MTFHQTDGTLGSQAEALADDGGMHVLLDEILTALQQFARQNHSRRRAVKAVLLLGFGDFNDHLRSGMLYVHFFENGGAVVGDDHVTHRVDEHLVHALWPERRTNSVGHSLGRSDVVGLGRTTSCPLCTVFQDEDGCLSVSIHGSALRHGWRGCLRLEPYAWSAWASRVPHCWFCSSHC